MKYLSLLTDDEIRYVCSIIPPQNATAYFQKSPKEFAKILPGFRPNAIAKYYAGGELLFKHRNRDFIASFINGRISRWLQEIQEHIETCIENGDDQNTAHINTLAQSFFVDNIPLYFKLIEIEHSEEYLSLLSSAIQETKNHLNEIESQELTLKSSKAEIEHLRSELELMSSTLNSNKAKYDKSLSEIKTLKKDLSELGKLSSTIQNRDDSIAQLKSRIQGLEKSEKELKTELSHAKNSMHQLEAQIRAELEKQRVAALEKHAPSKPLRPKDMEEFRDYLGYNFENIGLSASSEYFPLLKTHLSDILFRGIPVIINRETGVSLMRCVANTLIGEKSIATLTYSSAVSEQDIADFLSRADRIVCLDNFIGNYNETELLPLFERHRDKIIFLVIAYDKTLKYMAPEFLKYCNYLNLNRIPGLSSDAELTEDPATCDEMDAEATATNPDSRYSPLLNEILSDFDICDNLANYKSSHINGQQTLDRTLAFDVLPFCVDVLEVAPFNTSERLVKYAGDKGRCSYRNMFKEWFA
jgi:archaellum component FlaC